MVRLGALLGIAALAGAAAFLRALASGSSEILFILLVALPSAVTVHLLYLSRSILRFAHGNTAAPN
jgi:hypothetical protein